METAVSAPELELRPGGGRSNGVRPSLSSASDICGAAVLPAGVGAPRNFMAPLHVRRTLLPGVAMNQPWPYPICPDLELRQGPTCLAYCRTAMR